ncbi:MULTISPECIES: DUF3828 domain-containing protein [Enterobacter cloacae complex]|uniref:DUF3828 domain-containing protein n=1 Tax=Enterobacter cloacae complex TaxID=354276 RepID=UPI000799EA00|nr:MULTISPECIES: DUF3828 domain-containing protein [Enterobacter cloacae complex]MCF1275044.1 DUF3828 domain-containing protein [Enterobacter hormaechei]MDA4768099.1 DUF3828 domain-containing protein [Enterobacter hormaechei]MDE7678193.1 DUF3828 domain-containing protein [Enterobacter hormaechei]MDR9887847.1 DUF3828 domain-containing protein [Enterobacter hormaechei subsp. xiangfangensis]SAH75861.1 Protein of uncharacterised function (DUF3828) [Enterobacter cloacae]
MSWNKHEAVSYARSHAHHYSTGYCARAVAAAIRAGGLRMALMQKTSGVLLRRQDSVKCMAPLLRVMLQSLTHCLVRIGRYGQKSPFTGTIDMKNILPLLLIFSFYATAGLSDPIERAVKFNSWYVNQINKDIFPITDGNEIDKYVTASTMKKLRHAQDPRYADEEFYEADIFLKAQYVGDDWPQNVTAIAGDTDPVCVNVYIAFGKKKGHIVIDCMVKEDNLWKVQSVSAVEFSRNLTIPN